MPASRSSRSDVDAQLPLRPVEFLVLAALHGAPLHGYGLVREIEERTEGRVRPRPGDLYRVLYRLEGRKLLEVDARRPARDLDDERRTYYRITDLGRRVVRAEAELVSRVAAYVLGHQGGPA